MLRLQFKEFMQGIHLHAALHPAICSDSQDTTLVTCWAWKYIPQFIIYNKFTT